MTERGFSELKTPTARIAAAFSRWENDLSILPFSRPNKDQAALEARTDITIATLAERLERQRIFLLSLGGALVGEANYCVDPPHLMKKIPGTAWVGVCVGEEAARGKGLGRYAMVELESRIAEAGLKRIELGVFEFNAPAIGLYRSLGYREIGRIDAFTFWKGALWQDIRMERILCARGTVDHDFAD